MPETRYDPVKAHEYYERTKELKGRHSTSEFSDTQKEGFAYTKNKVQEERKGAFKSASLQNKEAVKQLRDKAKGRREEIREKLKEIMEKITGEGTATREAINQTVKSKIEALPKAPKGLSKKEAAEFAAKRRDEIAKIRGEAKDKRNDVSLFVGARKAGERQDVTNKRAEVVSELKGSLDKAKQVYETTKEEIKAKYESELDKEYNSIRANV